MSKAERTREFNNKKTVPIFNMKGFAGTSLSDMTAATGLNKGSIYGNFTDKDEVGLAAFEYNSKTVSSIVRAEMAIQGSYRDKLMVYVEGYGNFSKYCSSAGGCPIMNTIVEADDTHPGLKAKAVEALLNWKDRIAGLVLKVIPTGKFNAESQGQHLP